MKLTLTSTSEVYEILELEAIDRSEAANSEEETRKADPPVKPFAVPDKEKEVAGKID